MRPYLLEGLDCSGKKTIAILVIHALAAHGISARLVVGPLIEGRVGLLDAWLSNITRKVKPDSVLGTFRRLIYLTGPVLDGAFYRPLGHQAALKVSSHFRAWARAVVGRDRLMMSGYYITRGLHIQYAGATLLSTDFSVRLARHRDDAATGRTHKIERNRFLNGDEALFARWHTELDRLLSEAVPDVQRIDNSGGDPQDFADRVTAHIISCWRADQASIREGV